MSIEAMKQALAKFEHLWEIGIDDEYKVELLPEIRMLRQAIEQAELAKPEQEPVNTMPTKIVGPNLEQILNAAGFYKREWVELTIDESSELYNKNYDLYATDMPIGDFLMIRREIEAKLKEKNT
jgi:hypothetical protein